MPTGWFPFFYQRWLASAEVQAMSWSERGIYAQILAVFARDGELPYDPWRLSKVIGADYRPTVNWLSNHSGLTVCKQCGGSWETVKRQSNDSKMTVKCKCGSSELTVPKFLIFAQKLENSPWASDRLDKTILDLELESESENGSCNGIELLKLLVKSDLVGTSKGRWFIGTDVPSALAAFGTKDDLIHTFRLLTPADKEYQQYKTLLDKAKADAGGFETQEA